MNSIISRLSTFKTPLSSKQRQPSETPHLSLAPQQPCTTAEVALCHQLPKRIAQTQRNTGASSCYRSQGLVGVNQPTNQPFEDARHAW